MATERRELLKLGQSLGLFDNEQDVEQKSDLEILRAIVSKIKTSENLTVPESLAFPGDLRKCVNQSGPSGDIWNRLNTFDKLLRQDYTCRRQMLLKRLDCTVESFKWKGSQKHNPDNLHEKAKSLNERIHEEYEKERINLRDEPQVTLVDVLRIRETDCDKLLNGVVSSSNVDCQIKYGKVKQDGGQVINLKQVIIPHVPDRGGRADEVRPPPKETFGQQRSGFKHRGGHRGRRH